MKTKGQLEAEISETLVRFEKEHMGRGPTESQVVILEDMVLVRLQGVLTPAERQLAADNSESGRMLIKQVRRELLEKARPLLEAIVLDVTGVPVKSLHADISTITGERIILFTLEKAVGTAPDDTP
jgi:uncharacterized protein YbcI